MYNYIFFAFIIYSVLITSWLIKCIKIKMAMEELAKKRLVRIRELQHEIEIKQMFCGVIDRDIFIFRGDDRTLWASDGIENYPCYWLSKSENGKKLRKGIDFTTRLEHYYKNCKLISEQIKK